MKAGHFSTKIPGQFSAEINNVVIGVRPEYVAIEAAGAPATVNVVEPTGSETHLAADLAGQPITAVIKGRYAARSGDTIGLSFAANQVHVFDPETGIRASVL